MKLKPVTKYHKRNMTTSENDVISAVYDVIVIFLIYGQFGVMRKSKSRRMACKPKIFMNNNLLSYKN